MRDKRPLLVAYGLGVDSTAMLIEMARRRINPDAILFANIGAEKEETYRYKPVMNQFLLRHGMPEVITVRYRPHKFKNYPPYDDLETNCLSNGTLPSLAFGFKSCSLKWKRDPQEAWCKDWTVARECWRKGDRIIKLIGFDAGPADIRRRNHAGTFDDPKYEYRYPLIEWGWDRDRCIQEIIMEGLPGWDPDYLARTNEALAKRDYRAIQRIRPKWISRGGVPMKSSCFFCPAIKAWEVAMLPKEKLMRIVAMEARAKPRHHTCEGLWRASTKTRPGSITDFIVREDLLSEKEVRRIQFAVPKKLVQKVEDWREGKPISDWNEFFDRLPDFAETCDEEREHFAI
jgi:hypothetical protein